MKALITSLVIDGFKMTEEMLFEGITYILDKGLKYNKFKK
jgi:hypothetical protein